MFTGIVEELGTVRSLDLLGERRDAARLTIAARTVLDGTREGDSIAVNGCCLTVVEVQAPPAPRDDGDTPTSGTWTADVMLETLDRTSLRGTAPGDRVNLERAVTHDTRLGGHLVQGHVDAVATVATTGEDGFARRVAIELPAELRRYVVEHGSVAVDGVSLTVSNLQPEGFEVSLIPETLERTTLGDLESGSRVNVEVDQIARYAERLMSSSEKEGNDG